MKAQQFFQKFHSIFTLEFIMKRKSHVMSEVPAAVASSNPVVHHVLVSPSAEVVVQDPPVRESIAGIVITALAISNATDTILRNAGASFGLSDWALMQTLSTQSEAQPMTRLGIILGVTRQRIQKQIEELEKEGLVKVEWQTEDKRVKNVSLTTGGELALAALTTLWYDNLKKSDLFDKMPSQTLVQRRLSGIAGVFRKIIRADIKDAAAVKLAAKEAEQKN